jgi:hypothetical protein
MNFWRTPHLKRTWFPIFQVPKCECSPADRWHVWVALRFGKDSLNECAESTGVESNAAASPLAAEEEVVEEAET